MMAGEKKEGAAHWLMMAMRSEIRGLTQPVMRL